MFDALFSRAKTRALHDLQRRVEALVRRVLELSTELSTAIKRIDQSSQAELHARVMDLERAFEKMTQTQRRELGALHRKMAILDGKQLVAEAAPLAAETADAVRARLRAQLPVPKLGATNGVGPGED